MAYVIASRLIPPTHRSVLFAENGVIELGTALLFFTCCGLSLGVFVRTRGWAPSRYQSAQLLLALAAGFVALEEISYGQHLFGWDPPSWFARYSSKGEVNLHNLYDDGISGLMRGAAVIGFPIAFLVLPLLALRQSNAYEPGRWAFFLLPRTELVTLVVVAQSVTSLENLSNWCFGSSLFVRPGEVQEFFWAMAAAVYVAVLRQRLLFDLGLETDPVERILDFETRELRRAA